MISFAMHLKKTRWQSHALHLPPSHVLKPWLSAPDSLSNRLRELSQDTFAVRLLKQDWLPPTAAEACKLGIRMRERVLVREVELMLFGQAWVFGRSLFTREVLSGRHQWINKLGNKSLGDYLFKQPDCKRSSFEFSRISSGQMARRSIFQLNAHPIMVTEVFLPACLHHSENNHR